MGLKDFFSKIGNGLKTVVNKVGNGLKTVGVAVYDSAIKPAYNKIVKPVYNNVVRPVATKAVAVVSHTIDRAEKIADSSVGVIQSTGNLFQTISQSPLLIGACITGAYLLSRR